MRKFIKKNSSLITLLLFVATRNTYSMEPEKPVNPMFQNMAKPTFQHYVDYIGALLLDNAQLNPNQYSLFEELPPEIHNTIVNFVIMNNTADSIATGEKAIRHLAQVNKELNQLINSPDFCLQFIKHLAIRFECSDKEVAQKLQLPEAKRRLALQNKLYPTLKKINEQYLLDRNNRHKYMVKALNELIQQGIDLEFTIPYPKNPRTAITPLIYFVSYNYPNIVKLLIEYGVEIDHRMINGETALFMSTLTQTPSMVKILLDEGANPEAINNDGLTILGAAELFGTQEIIDLVQKAIDKKYED
jgi:hypothetical protein